MADAETDHHQRHARQERDDSRWHQDGIMAFSVNWRNFGR
jgi:hypothetical protein